MEEEVKEYTGKGAVISLPKVLSVPVIVPVVVD
jgi:hypothetical protein